MPNNINPTDFENLKKKYLQEMKKLIDAQIKKYNTQELTPRVNIDPQENKANESYDKFLNQNTGKGTLKIQVLSAREAIPIPNANVIVSKVIGEEEKIFYSEMTNESGIVDDIILPAPDTCKDKINISEPSGAIYDITIIHSNFQQSIKDQVYIFDGIQSTKILEMIPSE